MIKSKNIFGLYFCHFDFEFVRLISQMTLLISKICPFDFSNDTFDFQRMIPISCNDTLDMKVYKGVRFNKDSILDVRTHSKATETFQYTNTRISIRATHQASQKVLSKENKFL